MDWHIPNLLLKIIFFSNILLTSGGTPSIFDATYYFSNGLYLLLILPVIYLHESEEAPFMGFCTAVVSLLMDIFILFHCNDLQLNTWLGLANEIVKVIGIILLFRIFRERSSTYGNIILPPGLDNLLSGSSGRGPYEDIDRQSQTESSDRLQNQNKDLGSPDTFLNP